MDEQRVLRTGCRPASAGIGLVVIALAVAAAVEPHAQPDGPATALSEQIHAVRQAIRRAAPEDLLPDFESRLARASAAVDAGRLYLALYELEPAFEAAGAFEYAHGSRDVTTLAEFSARWKSMGEPKPGRRQDARPLPAVVEALAASADSRAPATYRASLPYARDSGIQAGLYYLGEAQAFGAFARFARALPWPEEGPLPDRRSIAPELDALDAEVTRAYERMTRDQHHAYMATSVALKRARALDERGHFGGALLEYLLARLRFSGLRPGAAAEPAAARAAAARARLDATGDHSIGRLFVELADASRAEGDAGAHTAAAIATDVLPAYHAALGDGRSRRVAARVPSVTITLVRWPFT